MINILLTIISLLIGFAIVSSGPLLIKRVNNRPIKKHKPQNQGEMLAEGSNLYNSTRELDNLSRWGGA